MKTITLLILGILFSTGLEAARDRPFLDEPSTDRDDIEDPEPWKENQVELPPYPEDTDLLEFQVDRADSPFRYFVDGKNLRVGDDGVVRYTLVIKSRSGAANVSFEGMRCDERQFKVYAYGVRGKFKAMKAPEWEPVEQSGVDLYHIDLRDYYLCEFKKERPYPAKDIVHLLSEGPQRIDDTGNYF